MTVIPAAASDSSNATTSALPGPSIIAVASSEMSRRGSRARHAAIASLCSSPPESPAVSRSSKPASPTRESNAPMSGRGVGGSPQTTSSRARTPSTWLSGLWKIMDVPPGTPSPGSPVRRTVPSVGDKRPATRRTSVDLPEPLGPTTARNDLGWTLSETCATAQALLPGYWYETWSSSTGTGAGSPATSPAAAPAADDQIRARPRRVFRRGWRVMLETREERPEIARAERRGQHDGE